MYKKLSKKPNDPVADARWEDFVVELSSNLRCEASGKVDQ
jgi:hypothetical protein